MELTWDGKLVNWGGNYDTFVKTKEEVRVQTAKQYKKQQDDIKRLKEFIASCGTFPKQNVFRS